MPQEDERPPQTLQVQPWIALRTTYDVEAWIDRFNRSLRTHVGDKHPKGQGICLILAHGGEIYVHTSEMEILLDVTPEAAWAEPLIEAATGVASADSRIWKLPPDTLVQLIFGLDSLIAASRLVPAHRFGIKGGVAGMG
jgi:hypothetical protein